MNAAWTLIPLLLSAPRCSPTASGSETPDFIGRWRVEVAFASGERHSFRFDAKASGKGTLLLLDRRSSLVEPAEPVAARWSRSGENGVTVSGPVEFPIGNVGRDPGTLVLRGTLGSGGALSGGAAFFPAGQDPADAHAVPKRTGTFSATRAPADSEQR